MDIQEVGGRQWYAAQVVFGGVTVNSRMTIVNGVQYTVSFSDVEEAVIQLVLESFRVNAAAEEESSITESHDAVRTLVSPAGDYSFAVPADFIYADTDTVMALITTDEARQGMAEAMGLEDASQLDAYFAAIQASNMMIVYDSEMYANLNVQQSEATLTMDMIVLMKSAMDQAMIQQYASLGVPEENFTLMDIQTIGGHRWYVVKLEFVGLNMENAITVENGRQYTFTFTGLDDAVVQAVLESFAVNGAE